MERATTRLKQLLLRDHALVAAGAFSPMPAKLAEQAGFEAVYMPGGGTALNRLGVADLGLITMTEMVDNAAAIARNSALGAITALLLGLVGAVIGGWMASGERMSIGRHVHVDRSQRAA